MQISSPAYKKAHTVNKFNFAHARKVFVNLEQWRQKNRQLRSSHVPRCPWWLWTRFGERLKTAAAQSRSL